MKFLRTACRLRINAWYGTVASAVLFGLSAACGRADRPDLDVTVRDSAGLRVVENRKTGDGLPIWGVRDSALLSIGVAEGHPAQQLHLANDALLRDDGGVVILNVGTAELRFFDSVGRHVRSVGRSGEGPGEYRNPRWVKPYRGDSLAVWDAALQRLSVLDAAGRFGRIVRIASPGEGLAAGVVAPFPDGSFLVRAEERATPALPEGVHRMRVRLLRYAADGSNLGAIVDLAGAEWYRELEFNTLSPAPFGRDVSVAASGDTVYAGEQETLQILALAPAGDTLAIMRVLKPPPAVTDEDVAAHMRTQLDRLRDAGLEARIPEWRRRLEATPYPEMHPAFVSLLTDRTRNLWMRIPPASPDSVRRYLVFAPDGRLLARAEAPAGLAIFEIHRNRVVGRERDALGVERVQVHRLLKGNAAQ